MRRDITRMLLQWLVNFAGAELKDNLLPDVRGLCTWRLTKSVSFMDGEIPAVAVMELKIKFEQDIAMPMHGVSGCEPMIAPDTTVDQIDQPEWCSEDIKVVRNPVFWMIATAVVVGLALFLVHIC